MMLTQPHMHTAAHTRIAFTLALILLFSPLAALAQSDARDIPCLIEAEETVELGSPVTGLVEEIRVERGDQVKKGQIIAQLNRQVERRRYELAVNAANNDTELRSAEAAYAHAQREQARTEAMFKQKLVSRQDLDKARTEAELARLELEQARQNLQLAKLERDLAEARLQQRTLHSPFDGLVADRYVAQGQRIQDQAIVRIARVDPLNVEVIVPQERFGDFSLGDRLMVTPQIGDMQATEATVTIIDRIIDPASNSFRMTLTLPNPGKRVPAGARCTINLDA